MEQPAIKVSIVVPTFNRANYVGECLDSLLDQSIKPYEVIVIDDGSEDNTQQVLSRYSERIRCIRIKNGGKPAAVNLGLATAVGDFAWIFDDDDVALPDAIETRLQALRRSPQAAFVYTPHYYGVDGPDGRIVRGQLQPVPEHGGQTMLLALMQGCFASLSSALVKIDAYRELEGFDASLLRSQDYDMFLRIARRYKGTYSQQPSFVCRLHPGIRGPKSLRASGADRGQMARQFDQRIGLKLRSEISLGEYLVPPNANTLEPAQTRSALLSRATVMASKGCMAELLEDIEAALTVVANGSPLTRAEYETIAQSIRTGYAYDALRDRGWGKADWAVKLRSKPGGRKAIIALADGLWRIARGYPGSFSVRMQRLKFAATTAFQAI